eukprot:SM000322S12502  [mRNA]  locus=s322:10718:20731:+ [translate_table: standard]
MLGQKVSPTAAMRGRKPLVVQWLCHVLQQKPKVVACYCISAALALACFAFVTGTFVTGTPASVKDVGLSRQVTRVMSHKPYTVGEGDPHQKYMWKLKDAGKYYACANASAEFEGKGYASQILSKGYLLIQASGGLNQQRSGIVDAVVVARILNATLVVPMLDHSSWWGDQSNFADIFDVDNFIKSLVKDVRIVRELPGKDRASPASLRVPRKSTSAYYKKIVLPILLRRKVILLTKFDFRLSNRLNNELQKLRCRAAYHALKFMPAIQSTADIAIKTLKELGGPYIALHLRFEADMLAFSGCYYGGGEKEIRDLGRLRKRWPNLRADNKSEENRRKGKCPLSPLEIGLLLRGLGYGNETIIYVASGNVYGGEATMAPLRALFPNLHTKDTLLTQQQLAPLAKYASRLAAVDYIVCEASDVFVANNKGNMARLLTGQRFYFGNKKTIRPDGKKFAALLMMLEDTSAELSWADFSSRLRSCLRTGHRDTLGSFFEEPHACVCKVGGEMKHAKKAKLPSTSRIPKRSKKGEILESGQKKPQHQLEDSKSLGHHTRAKPYLQSEAMEGGDRSLVKQGSMTFYKTSQAPLTPTHDSSEDRIQISHTHIPPILPDQAHSVQQVAGDYMTGEAAGQINGKSLQRSKDSHNLDEGSDEAESVAVDQSGNSRSRIRGTVSQQLTAGIAARVQEVSEELQDVFDEDNAVDKLGTHPQEELDGEGETEGTAAASCSVCLEAVLPLDAGGPRSTARLKCGHDFHLGASPLPPRLLRTCRRRRRRRHCIGSAFNAKGSMQCPNCRQVEQGHWLFAASAPSLDLHDELGLGSPSGAAATDNGRWRAPNAPTSPSEELRHVGGGYSELLPSLPMVFNDLVTSAAPLYAVPDLYARAARLLLQLDNHGLHEPSLTKGSVLVVAASQCWQLILGLGFKVVPPSQLLPVPAPRWCHCSSAGVSSHLWRLSKAAHCYTGEEPCEEPGPLLGRWWARGLPHHSCPMVAAQQEGWWHHHCSHTWGTMPGLPPPLPLPSSPRAFPFRPLSSQDPGTALPMSFGHSGATSSGTAPWPPVTAGDPRPWQAWHLDATISAVPPGLAEVHDRAGRSHRLLHGRAYHDAVASRQVAAPYHYQPQHQPPLGGHAHMSGPWRRAVASTVQLPGRLMQGDNQAALAGAPMAMPPVEGWSCWPEAPGPSGQEDSPAQWLTADMADKEAGCPWAVRGGRSSGSGADVAGSSGGDSRWPLPGASRSAAEAGQLGVGNGASASWRDLAQDWQRLPPQQPDLASVRHSGRRAVVDGTTVAGSSAGSQRSRGGQEAAVPAAARQALRPSLVDCQCEGRRQPPQQPSSSDSQQHHSLRHHGHLGEEGSHHQAPAAHLWRQLDIRPGTAAL